MANKKINIGLGFKLDKTGFSEAIKQIQAIKDKLNLDIKAQVDPKLKSQLEETKREVNIIEQSFKKAFNSDINRLNLPRFSAELKKAGMSAESIASTFDKMGDEGSVAFRRISDEVFKTGYEVKKTSKLMNDMFDTFGKTLKWGISSSIMNNVAGSIQRAVGFTKALDESLNNIRVVSGQNTSEMKAFAKEANEAAKALGKSTTEYTDASLIFFQQGKTAEEVRSLTEATLLGANVTGTEVAEMADLLTAVMNGYNIEANLALETTDKLAAVGAATGSDFEELAKGMSKVASMASVAGVQIDKLNAMLATVSTVTREAPESIGTSFKTIFGRMAEVKAGKEDEEGWTLGKVEETFQKVKMSVLDANGQMRDMGEVVEEVGNKWGTFDKATKMALANAMAGQRQANRLIALFENWDMYSDALTVSMESSGATMEQNEVRMDSLSYKSKQLKAEFEKFWMALLNEDAIGGVLSGLTSILEGINKFTDTIGGGSKLWGIAIATLSGAFKEQLGGSIASVAQKASTMYNSIANSQKGFMSSFVNSIRGGTSTSMMSAGAEANAELFDKELQIKRFLTEEEKKHYNIQKERIINASREEALAQRRLDIARAEQEKARETLEVERMLSTDIEDKKANLETIKKKKEALLAIARQEQLSADQQQLVEENRLGITNQINNKIKSGNEFTEGQKNKILALAEKQRAQEQQITLEIKEQVKALKEAEAQHKLTSKKTTALESAVKTEGENASKTQISATQEMDALEKKSDYTRKVQTLVGSMAATTILISTLPGALKKYSEAGDDIEKKNAAIEAGFTSVGTAVAMLPFPFSQLAGAAIALAGQLVGLTGEFASFNKTVEKNKAAIERYRKNTSELKSEISTLTAQNKKLNDLERERALVGGDLTKLTTEQQEAYKGLRQEIAETTPEMVAYYDAEGNAILKVGEDLQKYINLKKESMQIEKDAMVSNRDSFLTEYSRNMTVGEKELSRERDKVAKLKKEIDDMRDAGKSSKSISKKQDELSESSKRVSDLESSIRDVDKNIQQNIVEPFMTSNEEIVKVQKGLEGVASATFNLDVVKQALERNRTEARLVGDEVKQIPLSYEEMSRRASEELKKSEQAAINVSKALNRIYLDATNSSGSTKELRNLYNSIVSADDATKKYIGTMASLASTASGAKAILSEVAGSLDEFGVAGPLDIDKLIPILEVDAQNKLKEINEEFDRLSKKYADVKEKVEGEVGFKAQQATSYAAAATNPNLGKNNAELIASENELNAILIEQAEVLLQIENLEKSREFKQQQINYQHERYLMDLASTPEGLNKVIESYNKQYELAKEINSLMTTSETRTVDVANKNEDGTLGDPTQVEVESFKDSAMGQYFYEFENSIESLNDKIANSTEDSSDAMETLADKYKEATEKIKGINDEALASATGLSKELIQSAKSGNENAVKDVIKSVNKQQQAIGRMYAVINKDNTEYYKDFVAQNKNQVRIVGLATGAMADDYATYGDYTADIDKWMVENSAWLSNEKASNAYWAMIEAIDAANEEGNAYDIVSGKMVETADIDSHARSQAAKAAAYASAAAEAEAAIARAEIMKKSLATVDMSSIDPKIVNAVKPILEQRAAEVEADLAVYQSMMDQLNAMAESAAKSTGGGGGGSRPEFNYSGGGGNVKPRPTAPKPSSPPSSNVSSGGGGGSDKDKKEKEVEDLEWEEDIYHDINIQLEQKSQLLDKLKQQQDKLYGKELLDNLAKQKQLLADQQKLLEKKLQMQREDLSSRKGALSAKGVQFNEDGTISNYNELLRQKVAYVNSLSGEAKEAAKEEFNELMDLMSKYEELMMSGINETEKAIQDAIDAQREIFIQEFTYAINLKLEISTDLKEALDYMKEMNDEFKDADENYKRTQDQIKEQTDLIERLKKKLTEINNNPELTEKERLEMLEKYNKELMDATKGLKDLNEELTEIFTGTLKDGLDMVKEHMDNFKYLNDQLKHYEQTLKLIGEGENFQVLDDIYEAQYANLMGQVNVLNATMTNLQAQKAALEKAGMTGTDEWKAIDQAIKDTQKDINSLAQESLKLLQQEFKNSVDEMLSSLDKSLSGGMGLDEMKKKQQELKEERNKYLGGEEKLLAISKLQQKVQKEIDETSDPAKKAELQKFMDTELKKLKEKDKLTKYDVDRANLVYDLTLKQMALDDQRATKNIMRLVRDTQGNWVYEFTEDAKAIEKAQEDVSSAMEKLMELDKKKLEETQDLMLKLQEEYYKEVQQIANDAANGKYKTEEEMRKALQEVTDKYNQKMVEANAQYEEVKTNATLSSLAVILDSYMKTGNTLDGMTKEQEDLLKKLAEATGGSYSEMADIVTGLISSDEDSIEAAMKKLGITSKEEMDATKGAISGLITNMQSDWGIGITDMISQMTKPDGSGFKEIAQGAIDGIMNKWKEYQDKIKEVQGATGTDLDSIKNSITNIGKETDSLNKKTEDLTKKFKEEMDAVTNLTTAYQKNREEIENNIKKTLEYIDAINKEIDAIKRKNDTENENKPGSGGSGGSGGSTPPPTPTPTPPSPPPTPSTGSTVRVKPGRRWYYDSYGTNPSGPTDAYSNKDMYIVNTSRNAYKYAVGTSRSVGSAMGWLKQEDLQGFDTGGYTGKWGNEGKMALLHEKEIVLNKEDTAKILDTVKLVRGISGSTIDGITKALIDTSRRTIDVLSGLVKVVSSNSVSGRANSESPIEQHVEIHADFSGVKNSDEIEKAFENMANIASQYVSRK